MSYEHYQAHKKLFPLPQGEKIEEVVCKAGGEMSKPSRF